MRVERHYRCVRWVAAAIALASATVAAQAQTGAALGKAVSEVERLDALRSGLAGTFLTSGAPADQAAFVQVCKPVGQTMQQIGADNGWAMRQIAIRYRNPANAVDAEALPHLRRFERDTSLRSVSFVTALNGRPGIRYLRRITVERSCLACHGARDKRPSFVVENYAQDRAFGFRVGDLRGAYSVFIPLSP